VISVIPTLSQTKTPTGTLIVVRGTIPGVLKGTIVDLETTGLSPSSCHVITVGVLHGTGYEVFQASAADEVPLNLGSYILSLPRPHYAFNKAFEESFLGFEIGNELQTKPYERKTEVIYVRSFQDPLGRRGELVPLEWQAYLRDGDKDHLRRIIGHNVFDLLEELCLALVKTDGRPEVQELPMSMVVNK